MQLTTLTTTLILLLTPLATALPAADYEPSLNATGPANGTWSQQLYPRKNYINGKCIKGARKDPNQRACDVGGFPHNIYYCRNSNCEGKEGEKCVGAPNEKGEWVAKCPNNELDFEWDWPWHA